MTWQDLNTLALRVLSRWWIVALVTVVIIAAAAWRVASTPDQYRATTLMVVGPNIDMDPTEVLRVADLLNRDTIMATYADVMSSPRVVNAALDVAIGNDGEDIDRTQYQVRVVREPNSNVLRMIVDGPDREIVSELATSARVEGEAVLFELFPIYSISSLSVGTPQAEQVSLPWTRAMAISLLIGLVFGALVALWFDSLVQYRTSSGEPAATGVARPTTTVDVRPAGQQVISTRRQ